VRVSSGQTPEISRFFENARSDLLPRDYIRWIPLVVGNAAVQLGALLIGQRGRICFEAFPDSVQQLRLLGGGEAADSTAKITHSTTV
jgi:hypothetical protein